MLAPTLQPLTPSKLKLRPKVPPFTHLPGCYTVSHGSAPLWSPLHCRTTCHCTSAIALLPLLVGHCTSAMLPLDGSGKYNSKTCTVQYCRSSRVINSFCQGRALLLKSLSPQPPPTPAPLLLKNKRPWRSCKPITSFLLLYRCTQGNLLWPCSQEVFLST